MIATATTSDLVEGLRSAAEDIPASALEAARRLAIDVLGVAIAGAETAEGQVVAATMARTEPSGGCAVPVVARQFSAATAALVTGTMAYSIGITDTHAPSITHPGSSVVPTVLTVGELTGASGDQMARAIVLGVELICRIGMAVNPSHRGRGYHPTATCNHFGCALAASYLLGSSLQATLDALGIAGSMAGGLYEFRHAGSMLMAFHGGWPAHGGVHAAMLAASGFTGPHTVLEGREGFLAAFADETQPSALERRPGDRWKIEDLSMRPYCACRYAHAAIDALERIRRRHPVAPEEVEELTVWTHHTAVIQEVEPTTTVSARLCTRFNVAAAAVHGPRLSEPSAEDLADPAVLDLMDRISVVEDPELTSLFPLRWACRTDVRLKSGQRLVEQVEVPKGDPDDPLSAAELDAKFRALASPVIGTSRAQAVLDRMRDFGHLDVAELWALTAPASADLTPDSEGAPT